MFRNFSFDWISYLIGLLSGLLIWLVISQSRAFIPQVVQIIKRKFAEIKQRQISGADGEIRRKVFLRAQKSHLGSYLCELDAILIEPLFLAPPIHPQPGSTLITESLSDQLIPYLPFHPEFTASLSPHRLTFQQILSTRVNIAVVGMPGAGKSVSLAYLASRLSHKKYSSQDFPTLLPIYLHVHDLDLQQMPENPLSYLISVVQRQVSSTYSKQVPLTIQTEILNKNAIFILDGLDELHPASELPIVSEFLELLHSKFPDLRLVVSANPHYLNKLLGAGFFPFVLAPFTEDDHKILLEKWFFYWKKTFSTSKTPVTDIDIRLQKFWLQSLSTNLNPLETTLRILSMLSGDLQQGQLTYSGLETFLSRALDNDQDRLLVENLAARFVISQSSAASYPLLIEWLNEASKVSSRSTERQISSSEPGNPPAKIIFSGRAEKKSPSSRMVENLIAANILKEYSSGKLGFSHPQLVGYLAAFALPEDLPRSLFDNLFWVSNAETLHYLVTQGGNDLWIETLLRLEDRPLYWIHFTIGRWLKDTPLKSPWRGNFLRHLVTLVNMESIPFSIRADLSSVLLGSGDPSIGAVVKQLLDSKSSVVRRLSVLAVCVLEAHGLINNLLDLISDENPEISISSILALGGLNTTSTNEICIDILKNANENERLAASEALVRSKTGTEFLIKALTDDDLLVRRAAIHGLSFFRTSENIKLMEKVSVEDGQWIVRTAAAEALDCLRKPDPHLPVPLSEPANTPWIIAYTSKSGAVISKGQPVIPIFLDVLKNGAPEERLSAMDYLSHHPENGVISNLYHALYSSSEMISKVAHQTLWLISAGGFTLPSPSKYGLG